MCLTSQHLRSIVRLGRPKTFLHQSALDREQCGLGSVSQAGFRQDRRHAVAARHAEVHEHHMRAELAHQRLGRRPRSEEAGGAVPGAAGGFGLRVTIEPD